MKQTKKIGMLIDTYLPIIGGAEIHVLELSRALRKLGYEINICTAVPDNPSIDKAEFLVTRLPKLAGGGRRALLRIPLEFWKLWRFIKQVDFVHCHYSFLFAMLGTLIAKLTGKKSAVTLHGLGTLDSSVEKYFIWKLYRFISLKFADVIIATSDEMKNVALRFAPEEKIVVIPNGVNTEKFSPIYKEKPAAPVILTMRRLAAKNGVQFLVEAAPEVVSVIPRAEFWIAGEGKLESYIRQRVKELHIESNVKFIGIVPHEETVSYYHQADLVIFPSSAESTSLACLEAMSCEKPIIASSLTAYQDMLGISGERGLLVKLFETTESNYNAPLNLPSDRIHALAQAIIFLAKDDMLQKKIGRRARQFVIENYDWKKIAEDTSQVYLLLNGNRS